MRATAMAFTVGLLTGGAVLFFYLGQAPEQAVSPPAASDPVPVQAQNAAPDEPAAPETLQAQLDRALAEITALRAQIDAMKAEVEAKDRDYTAVEGELAQLRAELAEEREARIALERKLAAEDGADAASVAEAVELPDEPSPPPPDDAPVESVTVVDHEPAATDEPPAARKGEQFSGTGEFVLHAGDAWLGEGPADEFKVLSVAPADDAQLDRAEVNAFGNRGVVEQGAQVSHVTESGHYTLIVTRVKGKAGAVELLVQREG